MKWKIYYDDNRTTSNLDEKPENVETRGVMCIVIENGEVGRQLVARHDYFWYVDGNWAGGDIFGLFDYLLEPGFKKVLFGRTIDSDKYESIIKRALEDPDFPPKTARLNNEKW